MGGWIRRRLLTLPYSSERKEFPEVPVRGRADLPGRAELDGVPQPLAACGPRGSLARGLFCDTPQTRTRPDRKFQGRRIWPGAGWP